MDELNATTKIFEGTSPESIIDVSSLGKGLELVSSKKALFNHDLAKQMLELKDVAWERELRNRHVEHLIGELKRGTFLHELTVLSSCLCDEDGTEYRVNGQHTCWSRIEVPEKEVPPQQITVLKYKAKTTADLRRLYASFDRGTPRSRSNVISAYLTGTEQFNGTSPTMIKSMASALAFWLWEMPTERSKHSPDDVAYLMQRDHAELVNKVLAFSVDDPSIMSLDWMRRSSVFAAMMETFTKAQKPSEEFWLAVKAGIGFQNADDPRLRLRNALMTCVIHTGQAERKADRKLTDMESIYRWCVSAWNAWRAGESIKQMRITKNRNRAK